MLVLYYFLNLRVFHRASKIEDFLLSTEFVNLRDTRLIRGAPPHLTVAWLASMALDTQHS